VREILRIQSFPDWFIVKGKRAVLSKKLSERKGLTEDIYLDQRMQIGNAVPPLLAYEFGRAAIEALRPEVTACA
jgi:DNA (cytosine-5)-methyltransferase 1